MFVTNSSTIRSARLRAGDSVERRAHSFSNASEPGVHCKPDTQWKQHEKNQRACYFHRVDRNALQKQGQDEGHVGRRSKP